MRNLARGADGSRRKRARRAKDLGMYSRAVDLPRLQAFHQVREKAWWSAEIEICFLRHAHLLEERHGKVALDVIVDLGLIIGPRPAINIAEMTPLQRRYQGAYLHCESM